ncbi:MAG: TonB-dependent receptor [Betaproteobacteria bacterium]
MNFQRKKVAIALGISGFALVAAGSVFAQDIKVNVTGSNIKRVDSETAAPIETITREDIQKSGLQTISDVVRSITANNNGSVSSAFTNGFSAGGSGVSLRGLGPNNTLVLLNGRRMANYGLADDGHASYPDLQQIPFDAVERIEVLKDGASAIYGSDAVAGVVNVILRQQFTGFTATASGGTNSNGNGTQYKGAMTAGFGDLTKDKYNVFLSIDAQKQDANPMNQGKDYIGTNNLTFMGLPDTRPGNPLSGYGTSSLLGNVRPVNPTTGGSPGAYQSLPGACPAGNADAGFCRYEVKDFLDIQPQVERLNVYARGTYNFTDSIQGYAELSYFGVKTETRSTPTGTRANWYNPSNNTIASSVNIMLPVGHPDNPFNAQNQGARLYYVAGDLGGRDTSYDTGTQRYLLGLKGSNMGWDWDLGGMYIKTESDISRQGFFLYDRLLQGLAGTSPYGYYRIGANAGLNNPAMNSWIAPSASWTTTSENTVFDAKASKDLMKLAGGQLALAVGYEYRKDELSNPGAPGTETGNVLGLGYSAAFGSRDVNALYAELYVPVLKNLELTGAVRYDDYSDVGGTTNWKVSAKWTVVPSLVLRGTYATAFRAPGLYETSTANASAGFTVANDPVRCPVTGSPADCQAQVLSINTGNPFIKPETSDTYTVGLIWEPTPGLSTTVDYWNIKTKEQITIGSVAAVVANPSGFPAAVVGRDTNNLPGIPNSGTLLYVATPFQNANKVETDGVDLDITWKQSLKDYGMLTSQFQWTHVFNYNQTFANGEKFKYVGTQGNYDVSSGSATPEDRINVIIGWAKGPWNVTGTVRYVSDYQSIPYQGVTTPDECLSALDFGTCHVSSFTTLDLSASYGGFKNWNIFGSIVNVFNKIAPFNPAAAYGSINYNYNYAFSGATGTQFNLGARYTFN